jgi:hypothetical protein
VKRAPDSTFDESAASRTAPCAAQGAAPSARHRAAPSTTSDAPRAPSNPHARRARARSALACSTLALAAWALAGCAQEVRHGGTESKPRIEGQRARPGGAEEGLWTWRYPDGAVRERGSLTRGRRTGTWTQWWSNGALRSRGAREPDPARGTSPREGPWSFWHQNGALAARGIYRAGLREGMWEYSLDDGRLDGDRSGLYHRDERLTDG